MNVDSLALMDFQVQLPTLRIRNKISKVNPMSFQLILLAFPSTPAGSGHSSEKLRGPKTIPYDPAAKAIATAVSHGDL